MKTCSELTIKTPERRQCSRCGVSVNFERVNVSVVMDKTTIWPKTPQNGFIGSFLLNLN